MISSQKKVSLKSTRAQKLFQRKNSNKLKIDLKAIRIQFKNSKRPQKNKTIIKKENRPQIKNAKRLEYSLNRKVAKRNQNNQVPIYML